MLPELQHTLTSKEFEQPLTSRHLLKDGSLFVSQLPVFGSLPEALSRTFGVNLFVSWVSYTLHLDS